MQVGVCLGAVTWRWALQICYMLRRNTARIIKGLVLEEQTKPFICYVTLSV